jgi:hypothetical protein
MAKWNWDEIASTIFFVFLGLWVVVGIAVVLFVVIPCGILLGIAAFSEN